MSQDNWARAGTVAGAVGASAAVASLIVQLATLRKQASRDGETFLERRVRSLEKMIVDNPPKDNRVRRMQRTIERSDDLKETVQILEDEVGQ